MNAILYSTGCPRCTVLKKKLDAANIQYTEVTDMSKIRQACAVLNTNSVPILEIEDGHMLDFAKAVAWINSER